MGSPELNVNPQLIRGLITQMRAFREGRGCLEFHLEVVSEWARVGEVAQCEYCESRCVQTGLGSVLLHWERHRELPSVLPWSPRVVSGRECDPPPSVSSSMYCCLSGEGAGDDVGLKLDLNYNFKTDGFIAIAKARLSPSEYKPHARATSKRAKGSRGAALLRRASCAPRTPGPLAPGCR